jgi:hypothetical protein
MLRPSLPGRNDFKTSASPAADKPNLPRPIRFPRHAHNRRKHGRAMILHPTLPHKHVSRTNLQRPARPHHPRPRHQLLPIRRCQQIHLVLHRKHRVLRRHQRVSRISASAVCNRPRHPRMKITMLLRQFRTKRNSNLHPTGLKRNQLRPQMLHQPLPVETIPHAPLIMRIQYLKSRFFGHAPEYNSASTVQRRVRLFQFGTRRMPAVQQDRHMAAAHELPENAGIDILLICARVLSE